MTVQGEQNKKSSQDRVLERKEEYYIEGEIQRPVDVPPLSFECICVRKLRKAGEKPTSALHSHRVRNSACLG